MMNLSAADAAINCWNDKYYWDFWRPWKAIQRADEDGNPDTEPDPSWTALVTAPYPEHPSGHLSLDGAHLEVLKMFFGTNQIRFGVTSSRFPGETRYFDRFSDALNEIVDARSVCGPALPHCRHTRQDPGQEGCPLHGEALLPAASFRQATRNFQILLDSDSCKSSQRALFGKPLGRTVEKFATKNRTCTIWYAFPHVQKHRPDG